MPQNYSWVMGFINKQLSINQLPRVNSIAFQPLEQAYLNLLWLYRLIFVGIMVLVFAVTGFILPFEIPAIVFLVSGIVISVLLLVYLLFTPSVFKVKKYAIRNRDIIFRSGLINRTTTVIPFNRVQHIEIKTGPIDRYFKLSRLKIYTAGGSQSDLVIPGLSMETAKSIKQLIITKTASDEEE